MNCKSHWIHWQQLISFVQYWQTCEHILKHFNRLEDLNQLYAFILKRVSVSPLKCREKSLSSAAWMNRRDDCSSPYYPTFIVLIGRREEKESFEFSSSISVCFLFSFQQIDSLVERAFDPLNSWIVEMTSSWAIIVSRISAGKIHTIVYSNGDVRLAEKGIRRYEKLCNVEYKSDLRRSHWFACPARNRSHFFFVDMQLSRRLTAPSNAVQLKQSPNIEHIGRWIIASGLAAATALQLPLGHTQKKFWSFAKLTIRTLSGVTLWKLENEKAHCRVNRKAIKRVFGENWKISLLLITQFTLMAQWKISHESSRRWGSGKAAWKKFFVFAILIEFLSLLSGSNQRELI